MEPSSKRRRLAPKVLDGTAQAAMPSPQQQSQPAAQAFAQDQQAAQHYAPQEAVATQPERPAFEAFARHLQDAAMHIYNQTLRPHYTSVSVLLLRWEEDTSVEPDLLMLEKVFRERYKFQTDRWTIPTVPNPSIKLGVQMASFLDNARPDHLLIVYYAGHGYVGPDNQLFWASNTREDAAKLKWDGVRCLFEDAQSEILLLLETCAIRDGPVAGSNGVKQVIAAYTPEQARLDVGPRSFTACLADALHRLSGGRPFNSQRLFDEIVAVRQQDRTQALAQLANGAAKAAPPSEKNPVFFTLTPSKGQGIILVPLDAKSPQLQSPPRSAEPENNSWKPGREDTRPLSPEDVVDLTFDEARVLVCTTFVGDASPDMAFFNQWLHNTPAVASKITVQGMFLGPPTMLLISMPVSVWNIVQHDKVCCFLGYVNSHNMIHLYQRLVASASAVAQAAASFDGASNYSPPSSRRDQANHFSEPARRQERPGAQQAQAQQAQAQQAQAQVQRTPLLANAPAGSSKDDVRDSAEMKQAAEQLKALSHVRHRSDETPSTHVRTSMRLGDSIAVRHAGDPGSSPDTNGSGPDDTFNGGDSEFNTPSTKAKPRRPLQKQTPKQETRCNHCSHPPFKDSSSLRKHIAAAHTRPFPCAFSFAGCASTFGSKNEWKRHIASQHLCLTYYRCSACPPSINEGKGNEFNRKDLFTQHLRRMHAPFAIKKSIAKSDSKIQMDWDNHLKDMQAKCLVHRRQPPQRSACPKPGCLSTFEGPGSWDEWTEHVGRHMEKNEAGQMEVDRYLAEWAEAEGIIQRDGDGYKLANGPEEPVVRNVNGESNGDVGDGSSLMIVNENGNGHETPNGQPAEKNVPRRSSRDRTAEKSVERTNPSTSEPPPPPPPPPEKANGSTGRSNIKHGPGYGQAHTGRLRIEFQHGDHVSREDLDDDPGSIVVATTAPPPLLDVDDGMDLD
ncbi:zinc finger Y-chromosomal protein 1 [Rhypophila decipiens]|uniref:Zinc finger Y-chromosomal protein 1 n=1 Tax=Rhypophila decipiens TaxID=261697 RepID=A0AAN6XYT8_9PEZI|nr:zinc finger Y-chromosomal protein 1 [Rhypophila decipiens]